MMELNYLNREDFVLEVVAQKRFWVSLFTVTRQNLIGNSFQ